MPWCGCCFNHHSLWPALYNGNCEKAFRLLSDWWSPERDSIHRSQGKSPYTEWYRRISELSHRGWMVCLILYSFCLQKRFKYCLDQISVKLKLKLGHWSHRWKQKPSKKVGLFWKWRALQKDCLSKAVGKFATSDISKFWLTIFQTGGRKCICLTGITDIKYC